MTIYRTLMSKGWWAILLVFAVAAVLLGRFVPQLEVEASTDVLLNEGDPDLAYYNDAQAEWGSDEYAIVCATRAGWIDEEGVPLLEELAAELEAAPWVARVVSILDVPLLRQEPGPVIDPRGIRTLRDEAVDLPRAREELLGHTQAVGNLISDDGQSVSFLVYPDLSTDAGSERADADERETRRIALVERIRTLADDWGRRLGSPVHLSGLTVINVNILEHLRHDLRVFGLATLALFVLAFLVVYRRLRFVWMPILTCALPVVLIVGTMSLLGMKVTLVTSNLPVLLFVLMLPYTVYFIERYRERRAASPEEDGLTSSVGAARSIFVPCLFSCLTTMAGFAALMTSDTRPVHDFGWMMVLGMGIGLITVFLAIPAMSRPLPALPVSEGEVGTGPRRLVQAFARLSLQRPGCVLVGSVLLLAVSIVGMTRLSAQSKFTEYFRSGSEVYRGLETIDRRMGGTTPFEVILTSGESNAFLKPAGLTALKAVGAYFDTVPETGNVRSLATLVDELEKKNEGILVLLPVFSKVPMVREVTSEFANEDYSTSRVLIRMQETAPTLDREKILEGLREHLAQPALKPYQPRISGVFLLYANMLDSLIRTQRRTFLYVIAAILVMLLLLFRSPTLSLIVLLTQLLPAVVMLGAMGWFEVPLDLVTVMIASIAMGVGIDASIQYTARYREELALDGDRRAALIRAHGTIGRAIWIATTIIIAGFCVLMLSQFKPSVWFGLFTAVAMLMSQVAALTILPSIFLLARQPRIQAATEPPTPRAPDDATA